MVTLGFLLFISSLGIAIGGRIHKVTLSSPCGLDVKIRQGDIISWANPTKEIIRLIGNGLDTKLNVTVPPKNTAIYMFQNRGTFRYRTSPPCDWKLGIIRVQRKVFPKGRIQRSSQTQAPKGAKCTFLCNAVKINDLSSANLCRRNYDYVIRGNVSYYNPIVNKQNKILKKYVVLDILDDFRQKTGLTNGIWSSNASVPFLWTSLSEACFCPALRLGTEVVLMGYRSGSELVIDSRTRARKWEPKLKGQLSAYRHKVNTPSCV